MSASTTSHVPVRKETVTLADGHTLVLAIVGASRLQLPVLIFIVGSSGLGRLYHRLALELAQRQHFQCVYYDKRGFCSSKPTPPKPPSVGTWLDATALDADAADVAAFTPASQHADDAAAVIKYIISPSTASAARPAVYAFGTSTGATAVLELLIRHPSLVHTAILHEPILLSLVPREQGRDEIVAEYRRIAAISDPLEAMDELGRARIFTPLQLRLEGAGAAQQGRQQPEQRGSRKSFAEGPRPRRRNDPVDVHNARETQREGRAMLAYRVDVGRARQCADRIVLLGGTGSREMPVSVSGRALAGVLGDGKRVWDVPGGHADFAGRRHVEAFAVRLLEVLKREGRRWVSGGVGTRERAAKI